jgi:hypothetical protein
MPTETASPTSGGSSSPGFGTTYVQDLINSFAFGLDGRMYGSASSTGGNVRRVGSDGQAVGETVKLAGRDFSFDPRMLDLRAEGGGRPAGSLTSATGITIVRGDRCGDLAGMLVVGDVGSNLVHRKRIVRHGAGVKAGRVDEKSELVASRDTWFRPVHFADAPDGGLLIIDMQREVIEHPASLPPPIKKHIDLTSGRDSGRLWWLAAAPAERRSAPRLASATSDALVALVSHPNGWRRDTAHRLLLTRRDMAAVPALRRVVLSALLARDGADAWCRTAAFTSLFGDGATAIVREWLAAGPDGLGVSMRTVLPGLFAQIARRGEPAAWSTPVAAIAALTAAARELEDRPVARRSARRPRRRDRGRRGITA